MLAFEEDIRKIEGICETFQLCSLSPQLAACREALRDDGIVDIVLVGRFKSGKSSFLNSLIGRDIMPVDILPATAVVTRIGYGLASRAWVHYLSGQKEEIPLEALHAYVTEKDNPGNRKNVALVDVELDSLGAWRGIRFVDTPGLGSVYRHNTQTAIDWLPKIGVALIAVCADSPLAEQDVQLLDQVSAYTPEIVILLTKADLVSEGQLAELAGFLQEQISGHVGKETRIFPFSNRAGFEPLRRNIHAFLQHEIVSRRQEESETILLHKIRSLIEGCESYLRVARQAWIATGQAREELRRLLALEEHGFGAISTELWLLAEDWKTRIRVEAEELFQAHRSEIIRRLQAGLRAAWGGWKGNLAQVAEAYIKWLVDALDQEMRVLSPSGEQRLAPSLAQAASSFSRAVRAFQDRLSREVEKAVGVPFVGARFECAIHKPERPDIKISRMFDTPFELIWFLIPMWIFRPLIYRHFLQQIPWEAEKNLYRLSAQWAGAVNASLDALARQSLDFIRQEIGTLSQMLSSSGTPLAEIEAALAKLESLRAQSAETGPCVTETGPCATERQEEAISQCCA
ncbi:MAG: dynamin family protein [Candidatus Sumerlaeota bacterium]|nr:dynamin family protein [Candidatus Sumerlaeota bacterium]